MIFPCSGNKCSACCRRVGDILSKLRELGFPYGVKEDGKTCEKLTDNGDCSVYSARPDICNINTTFYQHYSKQGITKKEMFKKEAEICNKWQIEDGIDESFRVKIK